MSPAMQEFFMSQIAPILRAAVPRVVIPVGADFTLGDVLAGRRDDPAQVAVRNADWSEFMAVLDAPQRYIVTATAEGESYMGQAAHLRVTPSAITQRRQTIAKRARRFWGEEVLRDVQMLPLWRRQAGRG